MALPGLGTLIKARPWPVFAVGIVVAALASLVRDLIHEEGSVSPGEGVAIAVTLAAGICTIRAFVLIVLRPRRSDQPG